MKLTVYVAIVTLLFCRTDEVEARYYADGEDAYAMRRDLMYIHDEIRSEKEAIARKAKKKNERVN